MITGDNVSQYIDDKDIGEDAQTDRFKNSDTHNVKSQLNIRSTDIALPKIMSSRNNLINQLVDPLKQLDYPVYGLQS